jgi:hypothetical protein
VETPLHFGRNVTGLSTTGTRSGQWKLEGRAYMPKAKIKVSVSDKIYGFLFNSGFVIFLFLFPENWWWIGSIWCLTIVIIYMVYLRNEK